jgi:hypothetical protein
MDRVAIDGWDRPSKLLTSKGLALDSGMQVKQRKTNIWKLKQPELEKYANTWWSTFAQRHYW